MHIEATKRVLRHIKGIMEVGLCHTKGREKTLQCYVDANYCGDEGDRRSTAGCVMTTNGAVWTGLVRPKRRRRCRAIKPCMSICVGRHRALCFDGTFSTR